MQVKQNYLPAANAASKSSLPMRVTTPIVNIASDTNCITYESRPIYCFLSMYFIAMEKE